jgi:hypothetical protein
MSVIFQDAVLHGDSASMCLGEVARYVDRKAVGLGLRGAAHAFAVEHVSDAGEVSFEASSCCNVHSLSQVHSGTLYSTEPLP